MKKLVSLIALMGALSSPAWAATKTVTLAVPGMTCAACPITVKTALAKVVGVERTDVSYEKREAVVTYDDAKTTVAALTKATASSRIRCLSAASRPGAGAISTTFWFRSCTEQSRSWRWTIEPPASARICTSM